MPLLYREAGFPFSGIHINIYSYSQCCIEEHLKEASILHWSAYGDLIQRLDDSGLSQHARERREATECMFLLPFHELRFSITEKG